MTALKTFCAVWILILIYNFIYLSGSLWLCFWSWYSEILWVYFITECFFYQSLRLAVWKNFLCHCKIWEVHYRLESFGAHLSTEFREQEGDKEWVPDFKAWTFINLSFSASDLTCSLSLSKHHEYSTSQAQLLWRVSLSILWENQTCEDCRCGRNLGKKMSLLIHVLYLLWQLLFPKRILIGAVGTLIAFLTWWMFFSLLR